MGIKKWEAFKCQLEDMSVFLLINYNFVLKFELFQQQSS